MKRLIALLLALLLTFGLFGCSQDEKKTGPAVENDVVTKQPKEENQAEMEQASSETVETAQSQETASSETEISGELLLTVSKLVFSVVDESEDVYCGSLPRDVILWESADENIALVNDGVITAVGVGTTTVTAQFRDQVMSCEIGCLAQDQEELETQSKDVLNSPKRYPPLSDGQPSHFFDDAAVIGDSVSYSLVLWANQTGEMGECTFLVRGGNGILGYVNNYKRIGYQGEELRIEDAVERVAPGKLVIMLGVNDLGFMSVEETMDAFRILMERITERCPDAEVYLESLLPVWDAGIQNTKNVDVVAYNELMKAYAEEMGYHYLDVAAYVIDHTGGMAKPYCADQSTHMNYEGIDAWMQALKLYGKIYSVEEN